MFTDITTSHSALIKASCLLVLMESHEKPNYVNCCSHNLYTCQRSGQVCKM